MTSASRPESVAAVVCAEHGGPEVVHLTQVPMPQPGPGEVRVSVVAAAVNFPDVLLVAGRYQQSVEPPFIPGSELAGHVSAVGPEVTSVRPGDTVFATMMHGAFAEEVVVPEGQVHVIPPQVDLGAAAAFGVAHTTAYDVLRSVARVRDGEELVVLGAGGGVGLAAVELGSLRGARVTAVASSAEKLQVATSRGAHRVIDSTEGSLRAQLRERVPGGVDVVVDPVGGPHAEEALRAMRWGGRFVTVGYASGDIPLIPLNLVLLKGVSILGYQSGEFRRRMPDEAERNLSELVELLATGRVRPHIGAEFAFADVEQALRHVAERRAVGKVLLTMARGS